MVHLLLESLAEWSPSNTPLILRVREGHLAQTGNHAILLHHGVGHTGHLPQVILSTYDEFLSYLVSNTTYKYS